MDVQLSLYWTRGRVWKIGMGAYSFCVVSFGKGVEYVKIGTGVGVSQSYDR